MVKVSTVVQFELADEGRLCPPGAEEVGDAPPQGVHLGVILHHRLDLLQE
jgi:hypothetical protein